MSTCKNVNLSVKPSASLLAAAVFVAAIACGCASGDDRDEPHATQPVDLSQIPPVSPHGPKLASIAKLTEIRDKPDINSRIIGTMRAGSLVARSPQPVSRNHCPSGWFAIFPRGFVCAGPTATTQLAHPILAVMQTQPAQGAPLPYSYYAAKRTIAVYEWDRSKPASVREAGKLHARSTMAVIGSWQAQIPNGENTHLAMLSDGRFVNTNHIHPVTGSGFHGIVLDDKTQLPVSFIVKQGVYAFQLDGKNATRDDPLLRHSSLLLTGKFRTVADMKFWAANDGRWVRHADITLLPRRNRYPDFVTGTQKWIDISIVTGALIAYEGKKPVYATLCSVGQDRFGNPDTSASTQMGTFALVAKYITTHQPGTKPFAQDHETLDVPWALKLQSGQMLHGAIWHNRFGVEHGPGNIQLAPQDAAYLFRWVNPPMPEGWHTLEHFPEDEAKVLVNIRK